MPGLSYGASVAGAYAQRQQALRLERLLREAASDAAKLTVAERLEREGDLRAAARLYARLALAKPPTASSAAARQRFVALGNEARAKLAEIDGQLPNAAEAARYQHDNQSEPDAGNASPRERFLSHFAEYEKLLDQYGSIAGIGRELRRHVDSQRRKPEYAAILNEDKAKVFLDSAQARERENELCCAYWLYVEGAKLEPAPSAITARRRLEKMREDPQIVEAARVCRELQWCHDAFRRAMMLREDRPDRAKQLMAEITTRSPADSEVHRGARQQLAQWQ
jgi:hypothetical protein